MTRNLAARPAQAFALAIALATGFAGPALASPEEGIPLATRDAVRAKLVAEGYEVRNIKWDDGRIEVYATRNGTRYELYLDRALNVVRTKIDD